MKDGHRLEVKEWQVRLHSGDSEEWFNLGTQIQIVAAKKARAIYQNLRVNGMEDTFAKFKKKPAENTQISTFGEYVAAVEAQCTLSPETFASYLQKARQIIADIMNSTYVPSKHAFSQNCREKWREKIGRYKLSEITAVKVNAWKKAYVEKAGTDPIKRKRAEHTANSCLRNAKALFGKKVIRQLHGVTLPDELPFREVEYFRQSPFRYRSKVNIESLIQKANEELKEKKPEQYKIFILGVFVGLRRKEMDMLLWESFDWENCIIRIRPSEFHSLKSEASSDDVPVEAEIMEVFRKYREEHSEDIFVIRSDQPIHIEKNYRYYRANKEFKGLLTWLRKQGIDSDKPIHLLRKEFGRLINEKHGIFVASKLLRHSSIQVTASFYADDTRHLTVELGGLLGSNSTKPI